MNQEIWKIEHHANKIKKWANNNKKSKKIDHHASLKKWTNNKKARKLTIMQICMMVNFIAFSLICSFFLRELYTGYYILREDRMK